MSARELNDPACKTKSPDRLVKARPGARKRALTDSSCHAEVSAVTSPPPLRSVGNCFLVRGFEPAVSIVRSTTSQAPRPGLGAWSEVRTTGEAELGPASPSSTYPSALYRQ